MRQGCVRVAQTHQRDCVSHALPTVTALSLSNKQTGQRVSSGSRALRGLAAMSALLCKELHMPLSRRKSGWAPERESVSLLQANASTASRNSEHGGSEEQRGSHASSAAEPCRRRQKGARH